MKSLIKIIEEYLRQISFSFINYSTGLYLLFLSYHHLNFGDLDELIRMIFPQAKLSQSPSNTGSSRNALRYL